MAEHDAPINLNLATEERKGYKPYRFTIDGTTVLTFTDPTTLDWQVVEGLSTIDALAEHCMSAEDRKAFYETPMAAFKLPILWDDVQKHFDLGEYARKQRRA